MQVQLNPKNFVLSALQQHAFDKRLKKLERLCKLFKPDLVKLHAALSQNPLPKGYSVHLDLAVPSHDFAAITNHQKLSIALGAAFAKVLAQLRKYRARLRHEPSFSKVAHEKGKA